MFKALVLGLSATTNMLLVGVGGIVLGIGATKGVQALRRPIPVTPVPPQSNRG